MEEKTLLCGYIVQFQHEVGEKYFQYYSSSRLILENEKVRKWGIVNSEFIWCLFLESNIKIITPQWACAFNEEYYCICNGYMMKLNLSPYSLGSYFMVKGIHTVYTQGIGFHWDFDEPVIWTASNRT